MMTSIAAIPVFFHQLNGPNGEVIRE